MKLIISFSGRPGGNCTRIAEFIAAPEDKIVRFCSLNVHSCSNCDYECFSGPCKYRDDDIYGLYDEMCNYEKVILIAGGYDKNSSYDELLEVCKDNVLKVILETDLLKLKKLWIETSPCHLKENNAEKRDIKRAEIIKGVIK